MALSTSDGVDRNVIAAESWDRMHLLALAQPLAQSKLAALIVTPREHLCKLLLFLLGLGLGTSCASGAAARIAFVKLRTFSWYDLGLGILVRADYKAILARALLLFAKNALPQRQKSRRTLDASLRRVSASQTRWPSFC